MMRAEALISGSLLEPDQTTKACGSLARKVRARSNRARTSSSSVSSAASRRRHRLRSPM
jgi:hypothetical protein